MLSYNILVVEDDEIDQMNISRALKGAKIANPVTYVGDGIAALEAIDEGKLNKPLLILLDINMPRMNGIEFLQALRKKTGWEHTPVVILTTSNAERDKISAYKLDVAGYIVKPVETPIFMSTVATIGSYWALCEFPSNGE
jgi:CheY-like chemotaxis protein